MDTPLPNHESRKINTLYFTGREKSPLLRRSRGREALRTPAVRGSGSGREERRVVFTGAVRTAWTPSTTTKLLFRGAGGVEARLVGFDGDFSLVTSLGSRTGGLARPEPAVMHPTHRYGSLKHENNFRKGFRVYINIPSGPIGVVPERPVR